jgi:MFS family permease
MREVPCQNYKPLAADSLSNNNKFKVLAFASIGTGLELYDFVLYGVMLKFITIKFFPFGNEWESLMSGYISFAVTFLVGPLGSIFWGWYGDKFGRVAMLRLSLAVMALPSLIIAILPTYQDIGILAPVILVILRIIQGISVGGEVIGAKIFSMEILGEKKFGLCSGVISATGALGVLLAMTMAYLTLTFSNYSEFWRIPFLFGSILFLVSYGIRKYLAKSIVTQTQNDAKITEIKKIVHQNKTQSLIVFVLGALLGILSYTLHAFINPFLISQGIEQKLVYYYSIYGLISTAFFSIFTGILLDKFNKTIELNYIIITSIAILFLPLYLLGLKGGIGTFISLIVLEALLGMYACSTAIIMYKVFLPKNRCRGIMFNYALGCSIFGGLTPATLLSLGQLHVIFPAVAVILSTLVCLITLRWGLKNVNLF